MATITAKELAVEIGTDPKTVRKFLRSHLEETPGKGSRYAIERRQVKTLKKAFGAWDEARKVKAEKPDEDLVENDHKWHNYVVQELERIADAS